MDYNVWRIAPDGSMDLWDGPLSQEDAEKVRFCRQRDSNNDTAVDLLTQEYTAPATFVVVVEGSTPHLVDWICRDCGAFYVSEPCLPDACPECGGHSLELDASK